MSHPILHDSSEDSNDGIILKPKPRRPFELSSPPPSAPSTPPNGQLSFPPAYLQAPAQASNGGNMDDSTTPSRTRSFLNLTSSTLFGIYQPTGYSGEREDEGTRTPWGGMTPWSGTTPWGTGAQTPAEQSPVSRTTSLDWTRASIPDSLAVQNGSTAGVKNRRKSGAPPRPHVMPKRGFTGRVLPVLLRTTVMFALGVGYATMITHLHDQRSVAPVRVDLDRGSWTYLCLWGVAGVVLGEALPFIDRFWEPEVDEDAMDDDTQERKKDRGLDGWMDVVRSIGAFVGIAFAIRKLPWQSTLQLSLTLALANPALWYLIDRSAPGFILSTMFALSGTLILLGINPALVPSPSPAQVLKGLVARNNNSSATIVGGEDLLLGVFSPESVGVATWIASVLFVSSVCFGNIGRRLGRRKS